MSRSGRGVAVAMLPVVAILLAVAGCSPSAGAGRQVVTGRVTFGGQPVPRGRIEFEPDAARGNRGPVGVAEIVDGRYKTSRRFGAVTGPQVVRITGSDGVPRALAEGWTDPNGTPLFEEHVETIDVTGAGASFDFNVPDR